jgi:glycosyltransferase involved in cell wall biosynthesis
MRKVLLSAYACDPSNGSEDGNGYNWASGLVKAGFEVICITRNNGKAAIERLPKVPGLHFEYLSLPFGMDKLYSLSQPTMYLHYLFWQWCAYRRAKKLHNIHMFAIAHHVTWGSLQLGSFMYKLNIPFIFGPVGGGQVAPAAFKKYFSNHWSAEQKRDKVSALLVKYNPGFKGMIKKAKVVLVSNPETLNLARLRGAKRVSFSLDAALPESFFPENISYEKTEPGKLKLLWVGRFLPRKGILLLLDVMKELKEFSEISLTVVGDGEMRDLFLATIKEYSLESSVFWKGAVAFEKVRESYSAHDVFIFTSLRDSGGVQLVEAMAFGLPVITINLHGQAIIVNDETGFRCNCDTPETAIKELKNAIVELHHNTSLFSKMSSAAFEFAKQQRWGLKIQNVVNTYY